MPISHLKISNFRNLASVTADFEVRGLNIIIGNNASGKTSLLEAMHYLGLGKSFRSTKATPLIKINTTKFSLFAQALDLERSIPIGIERDVAGCEQLRMNQEALTSVSELASVLPLRVIHSQSHSLFEAGPIFRRKCLDWGVFYASSDFLVAWRHFTRALKQRNCILKEGRSKKELDTWTAEFVKYGQLIEEARRLYFSELNHEIRTVGAELLDLPDVTLHYYPGWEPGLALDKALAGLSLEERKVGHTLLGPQRADFEVKIKEMPARHFLSKGQQKLLICAIIIAQGILVKRNTHKRLIYLVDDLPAELDSLSKQRVISLLSRQETQVFITAIERDMILESNLEKNVSVPLKVFHVKQGELKSG